MSENPKAILIAGESGAGKSACLRNLRGHEGVLYINCEGGQTAALQEQVQAGDD